MELALEKEGDRYLTNICLFGPVTERLSQHMPYDYYDKLVGDPKTQVGRVSYKGSYPGVMQSSLTVSAGRY